MNCVATILFFITLSPLLSFSSSIQVGDSLEVVKSTLGEPTGYISMGSSKTLYYDRGSVELEKNQVVKVKLISLKEAQLRKEQRLLNQEQRRLTNERHHLERMTEGKLLLSEKLADQPFMHSSASNRVSFWRTFIKTYPMIPAPEAYKEALLELEQEHITRLKEAEVHQKIAALESRVKLAEERTRSAEEKVRKAAVSYPYRYRNCASSISRRASYKKRYSSRAFITFPRRSVRNNTSRFHAYKPSKNGQIRYRGASSSAGLVSCKPSRVHAHRSRF